MTDNLHLQMDSYQPLRNVVYETLRSAILTGELKPGERLMELQLADKLGVSRTPIREAIRMLEHEGLAKTIPRKGAEVAKMTEKDMEDVIQIRLALEELAGSLACEKITDEAIAELKEAMEHFENILENADVVEIAKADENFHDIIIRAAQNPKLLDIMSNLREQIYRYRAEYLKQKESYPKLIREHREMFEALDQRNASDLVRFLQDHLYNQAEAMKQIIREQA